MRRLGLRFAAVVAFFALFGAGVALADVVCRAHGINGYDREAAQAKAVLGEQTTSDLSACEVFITKKDGFLYAHSNFVSEGAVFPTKISTKDLRDLLLITANLYKSPEEGQPYTEADSERITNAHTKKVKFLLDQSLFDPAGRLDLDLKGAENLFVLFDGAPPPRPLFRANPIRGPPFVAQYRDALFVHVQAGFSPDKLFRDLGSISFKSADVRLASLIVDSALERPLSDAKLKGVVAGPRQPSLQGLQQLFTDSPGKVIVLLGHVEGENFVARDDTGKRTLLNVPLAEVEEMAAARGCDVIFLGCQSADAAVPLGVRQPFNPVDALSRFTNALSANNYEQFLRLLAADDMNLVFSRAALAKTMGGAAATKKGGRLSVDAYAKVPGEYLPRFSDSDHASRIVVSLRGFPMPTLSGGGVGGLVSQSGGHGSTGSSASPSFGSGQGGYHGHVDQGSGSSRTSSGGGGSDAGPGWAPFVVPLGIVVITVLLILRLGRLRSSRRSTGCN